MPITRRSALTLPLLAAAAACAREAPDLPSLPPPGPLGYRHLTRLPLNVASIEVLPAPPSETLAPEIATPSPAEAVRTMAQDRLVAVGTTGTAVFTTTAANLQRTTRDRLACLLACRLEILAATGGRLGFVEAQAQRVLTGAEAARARAADALLRRTMDDLNVEFEFQVRRSLRDWLVSVAPGAEGGGIPAPPPAEVDREELPQT